jgi:hypothetical protein
MLTELREQRFPLGRRQREREEHQWRPRSLDVVGEAGQFSTPMSQSTCSPRPLFHSLEEVE